MATPSVEEKIRCAGPWGRRALLAGVVCILAARHAAADPNYIENLTFFDRSPANPRANSFESVLRLDANDESFASPAGWGGGYNSWQKQFDHTKSIAANRTGAGLVFIGDSLTQGWGRVGGRMVNGGGIATWYDPQVTYARFSALNFGISGDQTQNVIYRVDHGQFNGLNPGLIVLMIGTNNLFAPPSNSGFPAADYVGPAHTPEELADGVLAAVQAIHQHVPGANILTLSALRGFTNSDSDRIAINAANNLVAQAFAIDENPKLHYLDFSSSFRTASGAINGNMNGDGIHLTPEGYAAWASAIKPFVDQYATPVTPSYFPNVAPLGVAMWTNSVDGTFGYYAQAAIDGDVDTMNHSDFNGSAGGNAAKPDTLTVALDKSYDLSRIEIVNRGALDGGSAVSDARLSGVALQVLGENPAVVLMTATLADDPNVLGETLAFDNQGHVMHGARFIRLTANNFLHVREIRALAVQIPEPACAAILGVTFPGVMALCCMTSKSSPETPMR